MLVEIVCDRFKKRTVQFRPGLNVILGDDQATNSIGKSSLLMVIDFGLGGNSLLEHNSDIVSELGHHAYEFSFRHAESLIVAERSTETPGSIRIRLPGDAQVKVVDVDEYCAILKEVFGADVFGLSFRAMASVFSRVWGKRNLTVKRPLHATPEQSGKDCVLNLVKLYELYEPIRGLEVARKAAEAERSSLRAAVRHQVIPKVSAKARKESARRVVELESEIASIREELGRLSLSFSQILGREIVELKSERDQLISSRIRAHNAILRLRGNLAESRYVKSRAFEDLKRFVPGLDVSRIAEVEEFHSAIARILKGELTQAMKAEEENLVRIDTAIAEVDTALSASLNRDDHAAHIVDRVVDVSQELIRSRTEVGTFDRVHAANKSLVDAESALRAKKESILQHVEARVNGRIEEIYGAVFGAERRCPRMELAENNYKYDVADDTGTGTAYSSLIVFDLAVLGTTRLPIVVHDSLLFKNIQTPAVASLLAHYVQSGKQCFIAIDEAVKYGVKAKAMLVDNAVIMLSDNELLYDKDWRKAAKPTT